MKSIHSISIVSMLCLIIVSEPCPAGDLLPSLPEGFILKPDGGIQVKVAAAPHEPLIPASSADTSVSLPEHSPSFGPIEDPIPISQSDESIRLALANLPPPPSKVEGPVETIADPLEPVNRAFFQFNDKFYFWVLKPAASGYKAIIPEDGRVGVRNFFSNLTTPIRLVNCLLQAKFKGAGNETVRFLLNSTFGLAGFLDLAKRDLKIEKREADFGQTLGVWGIGPAFFINWPILGPSSLRDTVGFTGDLFLDPQNYLITSIPVNLAVKSYNQVNETSLTLGEYEDFKEASLDPYIALKDAYHQHRQNKIKER